MVLRIGKRKRGKDERIFLRVHMYKQEVEAQRANKSLHS
jgi:hypothetical protein